MTDVPDGVAVGERRAGAAPAPPPRVLVLGYGNPGRLDDGLGPAAARAVGALGLPGVEAEEAYQLTVEAAAEVAGTDVVVFVDASLDGPEPFSLRRVVPRSWDGGSFSTHTTDAATVVGLARDVFGATPQAWLMGIRGYRFRAFGEDLSRDARANLDAAVACLGQGLGGSAATLEERPAPGPGGPAAHHTAAHHTMEEEGVS